MNKELETIRRYNQWLTNRYASILAALLVIWAAFLWWLFQL
jgi:hypothetical protein